MNMSSPNRGLQPIFMKKVIPAPKAMKYSPLTMSRSRILGDMYTRCDRLEDYIAVYLNDAAGEKLGVVDESLGKYADAFTFHLSEENCKMMAGGKFDYSFNYQFSAPAEVVASRSKRRVQLISIFLTARETHEKPLTTALADDTHLRSIQSA
jgi:hypothetical protein